MSDPRYAPPSSTKAPSALEQAIHRWHSICRVCEVIFNCLPIFGPVIIFSYLTYQRFKIDIDLISILVIGGIPPSLRHLDLREQPPKSTP